MTISPYVILIFGWLLFCLLHSLLASLKIKNRLKSLTPSLMRYYRLTYSLFFLIFLCVLLKYQFKIPEIRLYPMVIWILMPSLVIVATGLAIMMIASARYIYKVTGIRQSLLGEDNPELITTGIHGNIRHPLYAGTILFIWGLLAIFPYWSNVIACVAITIYVFLGIGLEERKLLAQFGDKYLKYRLRVPMIMPRIVRKKFNTF